MATGWRQRKSGHVTVSELGRGAALTLVLACVAGGLGVDAPAALPAPMTVTCGDTINAPGAYALAADCSGTGISITASDVGLRLNGHTMTGSGSSPGVRVAKSGAAITGVSIEGPGTITGYTYGVAFNLGGAGVSASTVSGLTVTNNAADGISLFSGSNGNTIEHNTVSYNRFTGIFLWYQNDGNVVEHNAAGHNNEFGIAVIGGSNSTVEHNAASDNYAGGILLELGSANTVAHNTASHDSYGIELSTESGDMVGHNVVNENSRAGISVRGVGSGGGNTIERNTANDNQGDGIVLANAYASGSSGNRVERNTANHNDGGGIVLRFSRLDGGSNNNTIEHNVANDNNGDGIHLDDGSHNNKIEGNSAQGNTSYDLFDGNTGCDSNTWMANVFRTANESCIH